jgi:hypothetical protein
MPGPSMRTLLIFSHSLPVLLDRYMNLAVVSLSQY